MYHLPMCQALSRHHVILQTIQVLFSTMLGNQFTHSKSVGKSIYVYVYLKNGEIIIHFFKKINFKAAFESQPNFEPENRHGRGEEDIMGCSQDLTFRGDCSA